MSGLRDDLPFDELVTVMDRLGELVDRGLMPLPVGIEGETYAARLDRLERAMIRQRLLFVYLLANLIAELRPMYGRARIARMLEGMAAQSDEDLAGRLLELGISGGDDAREPVPPTAAAASLAARWQRQSLFGRLAERLRRARA